jgi:hypothetical protein
MEVMYTIFCSRFKIISENINEGLCGDFTETVWLHVVNVVFFIGIDETTDDVSLKNRIYSNEVQTCQIVINRYIDFPDFG